VNTNHTIVAIIIAVVFAHWVDNWIDSTVPDTVACEHACGDRGVASVTVEQCTCVETP
jgi:hypothetical protein